MNAHAAHGKLIDAQQGLERARLSMDHALRSTLPLDKLVLFKIQRRQTKLSVGRVINHWGKDGSVMIRMDNAKQTVVNVHWSTIDLERSALI